MDDDGVLADGAMPGERPLGVGRADDSSTLGGYPAVADSELTRPDEPVDGADVEGVSVTEDDGVFHTESRELESLDK